MSFSIVPTFHVSTRAVSSVVALCQAFETKIVVSEESASFVDHYFFKNVAILEAVTRIGIAGRTLRSYYFLLNSVYQHSRSPITTANRLTIAALLPRVNIRGEFIYGFFGNGKSNSTRLFCTYSDVNPLVEIP